jgi:hypothetical protein
MLQSRSVKRAELNEQLRTALTAKDNHFFADTSFLITAASLNPAARSDLDRWIAGLENRFHVPAWVGHEVFGKISAKPELFIPMAKAAEQAIQAVETLQVEARRYVDDGRAKATGEQSDRLSFLGNLDSLARPLLRQAGLLRQARQTVEDCSDWIVEVVNKSVLQSDIYRGIANLDAEFAARAIGGHPPGFLDKGKADKQRVADNRYGDLIIWREILDYVLTLESGSVVLLTNDNKQDWVYTPPTVIEENGRPQGNDGRNGLKVILPLPLLVHEMKQARADAGLAILNLGMLAQTLHSFQGDAEHLFNAYQPIAFTPTELASPLPTPSDGAETDALAAPEPAETVPSIDVGQLVEALASSDPAAATEAVAGLRDALVKNAAVDDVRAFVQQLMMAAERDVEAASILLREIITESFGINREARVAILRASIEALYYDAQGKLRNRPLREPLEDVFALQTVPQLRDAVTSLAERIGPSRRFFMVTPDPAAPQLSLSPVAERDAEGVRELKGLYFGELALLEDVARDSPRSLTRIMGGVAQARVADLRHALAGYFCVPESQLDVGLSRFDSVRWDGLTGLIDWGTSTGLQLR